MDNTAVIRSGYEAFARGDVETLQSLFDPEIEWSIPTTLGYDTPYRGIAAVMGFFGEIQKLWDELHVEPEEILALGDDRVLALGTHHGRVVNGGSVDLPFAHLWTLRDGRATRFFEYTDGAVILQAQGLVSSAAAV
jgi:ketosteroid isomerase-like protein